MPMLWTCTCSPGAMACGGETDDLIVAPDRLARGKRVHGHLVPGGMRQAATRPSAIGVPGNRLARAMTTLSSG